MAIKCPSCGSKNIEGVDECANCGAELRTVDLPKPVSKLEQAVMLLPLTSLQLSQLPAVDAATPIEQAVREMADKKLDMLAVVDAQRLVGLFSVRDIMTRVGTEYAAKRARPVREFMTKNPETLPPDAPINYAINLMDVGGYRHVPVVRDGYLVGVVSARDVLKYLVKQGRGASVPTAHRTTSHGVAAGT
ncbi:MAG TPA: CBS domain-containing protein [Tepidisphaeraceae bacterium]|nr:CBS domain-containing protein [Tepidisphaeraceae bacterium]